MAVETIQTDFDTIVANFEASEENKQEDSNFLKEEEDSFKKIEEEVNKEDKTIDKIVEELEKKEDEEDKSNQNPTESVLFNTVNKLVEEGKLFLFEDKQDIKDYSEEELIELFSSNDEHKINTAVEEQVKLYIENLPQEFQVAAKYFADGGKDVKGILKALSDTSDITSLEVGKNDEEIVRQYYRALEWEEEDIEDKLTTLSDAGKEFLQKEASKVKPKLDKMQQEIVEAQLQRQENIKELQQKEMQAYFNNAEEAIKKGSLSGIKLDKKTQISLYSGITQPSHTTRRGTPTNELGFLLEKYQYVEPDFEKMYKVLWLLKDEKDFFEKFGTLERNKEIEKTVRLLKTEQSKKDSVTDINLDNDKKEVKRKTINRPVNFLQGLNK